MLWEGMTKEQRYDFAREKAAEGISAGDAAALMGVSRNVIIGIAHRASPRFFFHSGKSRWTPPSSDARLKPSQSRRIVPAAKKDKPLAGVNVAIVEKIVEPRAAKTTLGEVRYGQCHFPMIEGNKIRHHPDPVSIPYCGQKASHRGTGSYCPFHAGIVYQPRKVA